MSPAARAPEQAAAPPRTVVLRYGYMRLLAEFKTEIADLAPGDPVICRTERGTEMGRVLAGPEPQDGAAAGSLPPVLRRAAADDLARWKTIEGDLTPAEFRCCRDLIGRHGLPMKLAAVEHLLGGERIIFYFLADGRVDFRGLVRDLAQEYRTRIELRQIGVRDEARLVGDVGHCGRELCCSTFLRELVPVTMQMAKNQKASLDPTKVSGVCGRLMCCLRYEDETYRSLRRSLPRRGSRVRCARGAGEVLGYDILAQRVEIGLDDGGVVTVSGDALAQGPSPPSPLPVGEGGLRGGEATTVPRGVATDGGGAGYDDDAGVADAPRPEAGSP